MIKYFLMLNLKKYTFLNYLFAAFIIFFNNISESEFFIVVFFFYQISFFRIFQYSLVNLKLLSISNADISEFLFANNFFTILSFNLWYVLGKLLSFFLVEFVFINEFIDILFFNSLLLGAVFIGNVINGSDIVTYKNPTIQYLMSMLTYNTFISFLYIPLKVAYQHNLTYIFLGTIVIECFAIFFYNNNQKKIKYITHIIK